jgi:WD40 repeat protein
MGSYASDVCTMAFSPDDIYLAVGREDNVVQVWDSRYVSGSPMLELCHFDGILPQDETFGIARNLHWVGDRHRFGTGLGLVTGGDGGSLCLWDIQKAEEKRHVLAENAFSITTVLIPDPTMFPQVRAIV